MRKNSIKNIRINSQVQKELSSIIHNEVKDPRIDPLTSITSVEVAPDLKTCKVYISVLGSKESGEDTIAGLKSAEKYIRGRLAKTVNLRNTPEIRFILDQSIEYGVMMTRRIDELAKQEEEARGVFDEAEEPMEEDTPEDSEEEFDEADEEEGNEEE